MSLSPGLGCAAVLFLDWQRLQQQNPPPQRDGDEEDEEDDNEDDHGGSDDDEEDYPIDDTNASSTCSLYYDCSLSSRRKNAKNRAAFIL